MKGMRSPERIFKSILDVLVGTIDFDDVADRGDNVLCTRRNLSEISDITHLRRLDPCCVVAN